MMVEDTQKSIFDFLPDNWKVDRIYDHLSAVVGGEWGEDPDASSEGVEIPVIRVADIRDIDVTSEDLTIRQVKESKLADRLVNKNTFLIEKSGGGEQKPVGRAVRVRAIDFPAICSNFMNKIDCRETTDPSFIVYALHALYNRGVNGACIQQTTGIQNLRVRDYLSTKIVFPRRDEQERIAAYLDVSCAAVDAAVKAKQGQVETLDELRKSTITNVIVKGLNPKVKQKPSGQIWLDDIPEHWTAPSLKRLLSEPLEYGLNEAAELEDRNLPRYIRITDFDERGNLRDETFRSLPYEIAREGLLKTNDVLFARSGATVGKTFIFRDYEGEACFAGYLIRARPLKWKLNPLFLYYFTKTLAYDDWKNLIFTQATIQNISAAKYNYLSIPLPPIDEQTAIVDFVEEKNREFNDLISQIEKQIDVLLEYRKSLIHECVTGQRRVTETDLKQV